MSVFRRARHRAEAAAEGDRAGDQHTVRAARADARRALELARAQALADARPLMSLMR